MSSASKAVKKGEVAKLEFSSPGPKTSGPSSRRAMDRTLPDESSDDESGGDPDNMLFRLPVDAMPRDKALSLLNQLHRYFSDTIDDPDGEGPTDTVESENEEDWEGPVHPYRIARQIETLQSELSSSEEGDMFSLVLLGRNGDGKSLLINTLVDITCPLEVQYGIAEWKNLQPGRTRATCRDDASTRNYLAANLEAATHLRTILRKSESGESDLDAEEMVKNRITLARIGFLSEEEAEEEKESLQTIDEMCLKPMDSEINGFILPSAGEGTTTTRFCTRVRYGKIFHIYRSFKTEKKIKQDFLNFDWSPVEDTMSDEYRNLDRMRMMRGLLAGKQVTDTFDGPEESTPPTTEDDIVICPEVLKAISKEFEIISGRGVSMLEDRVFVRRWLAGLMSSPAVAAAVSECIVYCPADVLQGLELVDTPGTGTEDPLEWRELTDAVANANGILVAMQRNLKSNNELPKELRDSGILSKILWNPKNCPIILFSALDEKSNRCGAVRFVQDKLRTKKYDEMRKSAESLNKSVMRNLMVAEFSQLSKTHTARLGEDYVDRAVMPEIEARIVSTRPLLWQSICKCLAVPHSDARMPARSGSALQFTQGVRKEALDALQGHRMLEAIEQLNRGKIQSQLKQLVASIRAQIPETNAQMEFRLNPEQLEAATTHSKRLWNSQKFQLEKDNLLKRCEQEVGSRVLQHFDVAFKQQYLKALEQSICESVDPEQIKEELNKQLKAAQLYRIRNAFSKIQSGKTKNFSLFNIFFKNINGPSRDEVVNQLVDIRAFAEERFVSVMVSVVCEQIHNSSSVQRRSTSELRPEDRKHIETLVKEFLPKELAPVFRDLLSFSRPTDRALDKMFDEACQQSLTAKCLNKAVNFSRKDQYIKLLNESVDDVINGVGEIFCEKLEESIGEKVKDMTHGLTKLRVSPVTGRRISGLPLFLKLYRYCFKWIVERYGSGNAHGNGDDDLADVVEEFEGACDAMFEQVEEEGEGHRDIMGLIERRCLWRHLQRRQGQSVAVPVECKTKPHKLPRGAVEVLKDPRAALTTLAASVKAGQRRTAAQQSADQRTVATQLGDRFRVEEAGNAEGSLLQTLAQIAHRDRGREYTPYDMQAWREFLVDIVLERYQTATQAHRFVELWGEVVQAQLGLDRPGTVQDWATHMLSGEARGDAVAIDAYAYHYKKNVRLYTALSPNGPIAFPVRIEGGLYPGTGWIQIVHASWLGTGRHFLPVQQAGVTFTPRHNEEVHVFEVTDEERREKQSTGIPALHAAARANNSRKRKLPESEGSGDPDLADANAGLPPGWVARRSTKVEAGRIFWSKMDARGTTLISQWERP